MEYNELRALPPELAALKHLIVLIAHNNKLTVLPEWLQNMPQLLRLSLEFNPLRADQQVRVPDAASLLVFSRLHANSNSLQI